MLTFSVASSFLNIYRFLGNLTSGEKLVLAYKTTDMQANTVPSVLCFRCVSTCYASVALVRARNTRKLKANLRQFI